MPWYHWIAAFLNDALPQLRATRRTNLALLTAAILQRRTATSHPGHLGVGAVVAYSVALFPSPA